MSKENRYRRKERQRRQFTVTKTKAIIGFLLSLLFSLILSPAFDKVAKLLYYRTHEQQSAASNGADATAKSGGASQDDNEDPVEKLKRISKQGRGTLQQGEAK